MNFNLTYLCMGLIFFALSGVSHSISSAGSLYCRWQSVKRVFTISNSISAKHSQDCALRCDSNPLCSGFNFISDQDPNCVLTQTQANVTCNALQKNMNTAYHEKKCKTISINETVIPQLAENDVIPFCYNGGSCVDTPLGASCVCPAGYEGNYCEKKINPCDSSPCLNNGICTPNGLSFTCDCSATPYGGLTCQHSNIVCGAVRVGSSNGGSPFTDASYKGPAITGFRVDFDALPVSNFQLRYGNSWGPVHKTLSPNYVQVLFDPDEYVTGIEGYAPSWCRSFHIFTNKRNYGPYGDHPTSGLTTESHCGPNTQLKYISGQQGQYYDSLYWHFE